MSKERPEKPLPHHPESPPGETKDISSVLKGWEYEAGAINVRKIAGNDGKEKLQMRLDLGLLQMEVQGRPDGQRPYGRESFLEYFEEQLRRHTKRHGTGLGFALSGDQCQQLREEAVMYYHRYLSLFILGDFPGVIRDTARNLRVLDICGEYAADESDRFVLEQYRPYIIMMNTRATASLQFKDEQYPKAYHTVTEGLDRIREFFIRFGQQEAFDKSNEVKILKRFARDIKRKLPVDPVDKLQGKLDRAVKREDYEEAARLRDEIQVRKAKRESSGA
ncbi:MAG TPA: UvrB/UvrC motif-containing protein [Tepidisphaeraceae bacterium]|jgi:hypothetical protein